MEALSTLLEHIKKQGLAKGNLLGFFHVFIGRRITSPKGTVLSTGLPWRDLSNWLKKGRWEPDLVKELGLDPDLLPPKDRQRFWYSAITKAGVDSAAAKKAGDQFAQKLEALGFQVGPTPGSQ